MEAKELNKIIKERGIKQTWIAEKIGVSKGLVNQWIKFKTDISPRHQIELKNILSRYN